MVEFYVHYLVTLYCMQLRRVTWWTRNSKDLPDLSDDESDFETDCDRKLPNEESQSMLKHVNKHSSLEQRPN
jgi:hypothetical protein